MVFAGHDPNWPEAVRRCLTEPLPVGLIVATLGTDGIDLRMGPRPYAIVRYPIEVAVLLDSRRKESTQVEVCGSLVDVPAGGVELITLSEPGLRTIEVGPANVPASEAVALAQVRLRARAASRWSVTDDHGGTWFPHGKLRKWDMKGRPMFHGNEIELDVPAVPLTIRCARGMEFDSAETTITPEPGATIPVELEPRRLYETAARGWYGADLHVHMNYSGDCVCSPDDAASMQLGEGLHLMNLVAANIAHTRVYDREAFEATAGHDLPWSTDERVARFGVEYRNDLLGHFHALGPTRRPTRFFTGHPQSDQPFDWPPNATACDQFRSMGAVVGYAHPVFASLRDGSAAEAFRSPRSMDARELVVDAALGLVDSIDLIGPNDVEGTAILYHHLLNCGLRLAATVGTDVWLSYSRGPLLSNPPGWARVYADLRGAPLSVEAFQDAIRAGRTLATNGPWLDLQVDEWQPGDVVTAEPGQTVSVSVRSEGVGVESIELIGPEGLVARSEATARQPASLDANVRVARSMWLCAVARGPQHQAVLGPVVFAHTSPVYIDVLGHPLESAGSARWLLDWLRRLEELVRTHGHFAGDTQRDQLIALVQRARGYYQARAA
jgi:hypothetical protein